MASADGSSGNLAIVPEKMPARKAGGCVGVFVQFFEWNRRLAKKKFFSRKLLPSDRLPRNTSKRSVKAPVTKTLSPGDGVKIKPGNIDRSSLSLYEKERAVSTPGLVARLMGLDSMPASSRHTKPKKLDFSPHKLRKNSLFDRRKSSEAMISRSRKPNSKLIPPIKNPRVAGKKSSARLMGAASKILEPGLQSRNRRYSLEHAPLPDEKSGGCPKFLSSCHNCGKMVEVHDGDISSSSSSSYSSSDLSTFSRERERERIIAAASCSSLRKPRSSKGTDIRFGRRKVPEAEEREEISLSRRLLDQRIDALSILLGQKIRALTSDDPDRSSSTAAAVLQELIAALSAAAVPVPPPSDRRVHFERSREKVNASVLQDQSVGGIDQESPLSILESAFLNETCFSESFNSSSARQAHGGILASSIEDSRSCDIDTDLSDSGKSTAIRVPRGSSNSYTWGVISKLELLFKGIAPILTLIMQTLETLDPRIRRLLFDATIEHLDKKYASFINLGFRSWLRMPSLGLREIRSEMAKKIRVYGVYPRKGKTLAKMMEDDMGEVNSEWVDFHVEVFDWGAEFGDGMMGIMIDEMVMEMAEMQMRNMDRFYFYYWE